MYPPEQQSTRLAAALLIAVLAGVACKPGPPRFGEITEDFVLGSLSMSPVAATAAGYHLHAGVPLDELLDDLSEAGIERRRGFLDAFDKRLAAMDRARLTAQDQADYDLILNRIRQEQLNWNVLQTYKHDPTLYVELIGRAIFAPYTLEYAPKELRFFHIARRLETAPALLKHAQRNLVDSPEVHRETARQSIAALISVIETTLASEAPPGIRDKFAAAAANAVAALREFDAFLAGELTAKVSDWRVGSTHYDQKFRLSLMSDRASDDVLADAERAMEEIRAEMARLAGKDVRKALNRIAERHATRGDYFASAERDLEEAIQFVKAKVLMPLPDTKNLRVVATPEFQRASYPVGAFNPAPALQPSLEAQYWLTPIPEDWSRERAESKLREYNFYGLKLLTIHEAMPGHYVQFEYASRIEPRGRRLLRSLFGSGTYVEGWAVYATHMMIEEGYLSGDPGLRLTFLKQMLRVASNAILDIRMHTGRMTDEEAMRLMIDGAYQEREEAEAKLRRVKLTSCQLPTYFVGWVDFLRLRARFRGYQGASFLLPKFHEAVLREGALPVPALSVLLTGQPLADRYAVPLIPAAPPSEE
jgi:uncharacterized protein (DUF885 family)